MMVLSGWFRTVAQAFLAGVARLDTSLSPSITFQKVRQHRWHVSDLVYVFNILLAAYWFTIMQSPAFPLKLLIPIAYAIVLIIPATSQFFFPASPIFIYLLSFYSSRFIPPDVRPAVSVSLLPTLESVLYGANISDILTHFTHPVLDVIAWIPYGVGHFTLPFLVGLFTWLFRDKKVLHLWGRVFGYMNLAGVLIQILFPCSPPWYEVIHGLTPANYGMKGSPGGLARIDALLHIQTYTTAFTNSPMVFGAFPSLHAGSATMEALFLAHFFPQLRRWVWGYAAVLYWATMYLTHHYLIDVVGGACMATAFFYLFLPDEFKGAGALAVPYNFAAFVPGYVGGQHGRQPRKNGSMGRGLALDLEDRAGPSVLPRAEDYEFDAESSEEEGEMDITYRSPVPQAANGKFQQQQQEAAVGGAAKGKTHRHTASLVEGGGGRGEVYSSPVTGTFVFPPGAQPVR